MFRKKVGQKKAQKQLFIAIYTFHKGFSQCRRFHATAGCKCSVLLKIKELNIPIILIMHLLKLQKIPYVLIMDNHGHFVYHFVLMVFVYGPLASIFDPTTVSW